MVGDDGAQVLPISAHFFLSPFIPLWATVTRPMLSVPAKAVNYQTQAKRMAGRPGENLEKCAGERNARDMERPFHVSSF